MSTVLSYQVVGRYRWLPAIGCNEMGGRGVSIHPHIHVETYDRGYWSNSVWRPDLLVGGILASDETHKI